MKKIISLLIVIAMSCSFALTFVCVGATSGQMPIRDVSVMEDITSKSALSQWCYDGVLSNEKYWHTYANRILLVDNEPKSLKNYVFKFTGKISGSGTYQVLIGGTDEASIVYKAPNNGYKAILSISSTKLGLSVSSKVNQSISHNLSVGTQYEGYISYADGEIVYGIKEKGADDSSYVWDTASEIDIEGTIVPRRSGVPVDVPFSISSLYVAKELKASVEDRFYDVNPGKITLSFNDILSSTFPESVKVSAGTNDNNFIISRVDDYTAEITIPDGILEYDTEYTVDLSGITSQTGSNSSSVVFKTVEEVKANIYGEQIAREGTEIVVELSVGDEEYSLTIDVPDTITISTSEKQILCSSYAEDNKIIFVLSEQLEYSTSYNVDLSQVSVSYKVNEIEYTVGIENISFSTNNGEKELALKATNDAETAEAMVLALEAFNEFDVDVDRVDFFADKYFTNVQADNEKLTERKKKFGAGLVAYRDENGNFTKIDFSDLELAIADVLKELKIMSYTIAEEAAEDMLDIFTDTEFYDTSDKKIVSAALITELMNGEICKDAEELKALEAISKSIMVVSGATNDDIIAIFDDAEKYDLGNIIDLENEDYKKNKSAVAKKMTELRPQEFIYYTVEMLKNDFSFSNALTAVNVANTRLAKANAISTYGNVLGLDLTEYNKYDSNLVCVNLVDTTFDNAEQIQQAINQRIVELKSNSTNSSKPSGNRGGGGGGGGAVIAPVPTAQPVQNVPVESVKEPFKDLNSVTWAKTAIESLYANGKLNGVSEGVFEPNRNITRAEFSKLLADIFEISTSESIEFTDVNINDWYYKSVLAVASAGIVKGNGNGEFMPNKPLTRQDMAVMIYRLLASTNNSNAVSKDGSVDGFNDVSEISDYAVEAVGKLYSNGIVYGVGDNCFAPLNNTTRAEAAVILYRISNSLGGEIHE